MDYAERVAAALRAAGIRAEVDTSRERMGAKIREAQLQKVPYMLVVGARRSGGHGQRAPAQRRGSGRPTAGRPDRPDA